MVAIQQDNISKFERIDFVQIQCHVCFIIYCSLLIIEDDIIVNISYQDHVNFET